MIATAAVATDAETVALRYARLDSSGTTTWQRTIEPIHGSYSHARLLPTGLAVGPSGGIFIAGLVLGWVQWDACEVRFGRTFVASLDANGTCLWAQAFDADVCEAEGGISALAATQNGGVIAGGALRGAGVIAGLDVSSEEMPRGVNAPVRGAATVVIGLDAHGIGLFVHRFAHGPESRVHALAMDVSGAIVVGLELFADLHGVDLSATNSSAVRDDRAVVAVLGASGELIWSRDVVLDDAADTYASAVAPTPDGRVIATVNGRRVVLSR